LRSAKVSLIETLAHFTWIDALLDDPFTKFMMGGDMSLIPLELGANVRAAVIGGEIYVATVGPEPKDIVGAAIWFAPGQSTMSTCV
jgi:hypothetical protein